MMEGLSRRGLLQESGLDVKETPRPQDARQRRIVAGSRVKRGSRVTAGGRGSQRGWGGLVGAMYRAPQRHAHLSWEAPYSISARPGGDEYV